MSPHRIAGLILLIGGISFLVFGLNASRSVSDSVSHAFTGKFTDQTMWYIVGGAVAILAGSTLVFFGSGRSRNA
jgi:uncharacterized protein DUF3185